MSNDIASMSFEKQATHSNRSSIRRGSMRFAFTILFMCIGTGLFVGVLSVSAMVLGYSTEVVVTPMLRLLTDIQQTMVELI